MVLKKNKKSNDILFIDASKECVKITNNNKLTDENISNIVGIYADRTDKEYVSKVVNCSEVGAKDYNCSVSTYVEQEDTREVIDIAKLNAEISELVMRIDELRASINEIIEEIEG